MKKPQQVTITSIKYRDDKKAKERLTHLFVDYLLKENMLKGIDKNEKWT